MFSFHCERKRAIENLLTPMKMTLDQVEREIKESERHRVQTSTELLLVRKGSEAPPRHCGEAMIRREEVEAG